MMLKVGNGDEGNVGTTEVVTADNVRNGTADDVRVGNGDDSNVVTTADVKSWKWWK